MRAVLRLPPSLTIGAGLVGLLVVVAMLAPWLAAHDPAFGGDLHVADQAPSLAYPFGTDEQGHDMLSMVLYGARVSLAVGVVTQLANAVIGIVLGLTAGYFGGWWDDLVGAFTGIFLTVPTLVFALAIMAVLGPGLINVFVALAVTHWAYTCRITRSQVLLTRSLGYVQAARVLGYGDWRIMFGQILLNIAGPIIIITTLGVGAAILLEAALSFVGLGAQAPDVSWGLMLSTARDVIFTSPWMSIFPGLAIFLAVLGFNLLGDGLRDWLDPHGTRGAGR